ncbi:MAG: hypothetical protein NTU44_15980 [Bacteroidetes bacterium]|nr:hypothetical protein [Bacteroidota bacterium]
MKIYISYILFFGIIMIVSCVNIHSNFTCYKVPPFIEKDTISIKIDGKYIVNSLDEKYFVLDKYFKSVKINYPGKEFYLYKDGSFYIEYGGVLGYKENWGCYIVRSDSIFIQFFIRQSDSWMKRNTIELYGLVKKDSIIIFKQINNLGEGTSGLNPEILNYSPPAAYYFFRTEYKPDSTIAWYKQRRWYKNWAKEKK